MIPRRVRASSEPPAPPEAPLLVPFAEARESPCARCEAWCCANLSLPEFVVADIDRLDWARYLLNFEGIRILLTKSGRWIPYWRQACRYFDIEGHLCKVHGTDLQPHTCVSYNPYTCYYRTTFPAQEDDEQVWLDRRRLGALLTGVHVDEDRERVVLPPFDAVRRVFESVPLEPLPPLPDLGKRPPEPAGRREPRTGLRFGDPEVQTPCDGCAAYCCTWLVIPVGKPPDATLVDYLRYALGFAGVELVVTEETWSLALPTTCRHLEGSRCGVYGKDDRPLRCEYYDAWKCTYRDTFGPRSDAPDSGNGVRLRYEDFPLLLSLCEFDDRGRLPVPPAPADLAAALAGAAR